MLVISATEKTTFWKNGAKQYVFFKKNGAKQYPIIKKNGAKPGGLPKKVSNCLKNIHIVRTRLDIYVHEKK